LSVAASRLVLDAKSLLRHADDINVFVIFDC